jgi:LPXTG-motif cell wall-anchored protein
MAKRSACGWPRVVTWEVAVKTGIAKLAAGLALTFGLTIGAAGSIAAQGADTASLTVHQRLCGEDYQGGNPFEECHDVLVGDSYDFTIDGPVAATAATDAATGNVTFNDVPAGSYEVYGGVPGEFSVKEVYCSDIASGEAVALTVTETDMGFQVDVTAGAEVVCDVYEHPVDLSGEDPDDGDDEPVTELPNTGAGMTSTESVGIGLLLAALGLGTSGVALRRRSFFS